MSLKERAPARTTPYNRFYCNDCNSKFQARYLANRNTQSTQHYCRTYLKVVTRKVGQKSQKCEADHDGPCLIERKATRPGYDSEDEAKANQREDRKNGLIGSKKNGGASKGAAAPKRTNNVRLGNSNKSKSKNKNKNKNKDKENKDESGSDSDNYQSGFLLANEKQFEQYLYKKNKSKKRYQTQRDEDSDQDHWLPTQQDKKRRRKNKSKNKNNEHNGARSNGHNKVRGSNNARKSEHTTVEVPQDSDEEDFDVAGLDNNHNGKNNGNSNNKANANKPNGSKVYIKPITKPRPLVTVVKSKNDASEMEHVKDVPSVLPIDPNAPIDSDNDDINTNGNGNEHENENENENKAEGGSNRSNSSNSNHSNPNGNRNGRGRHRYNEDRVGHDDGHDTIRNDDGWDDEEEDGNGSGSGSGSGDNEEKEARQSEAFGQFVKVYSIATEFMKESSYEEAIDTLTPAMDSVYYQECLKTHPIFSESYLILAHAHQGLEQQEEALNCLENIAYFDNLPTQLQIRIKDTEVQLLEYLQRFDEARQVKFEIQRLTANTSSLHYYH